MTTVSTKTFLENPIHFFNLARREDLAIKRGNSLFHVVYSTPSDNVTLSKSMRKALDDEKNGRVTKLVNHKNAVAEILG
jgi:hypothetical protein